jgi:hypothetical protein
MSGELVFHETHLVQNERENEGEARARHMQH